MRYRNSLNRSCWKRVRGNRSLQNIFPCQSFLSLPMQCSSLPFRNYLWKVLFIICRGFVNKYFNSKKMKMIIYESSKTVRIWKQTLFGLSVDRTGDTEIRILNIREGRLYDRTIVVHNPRLTTVSCYRLEFRVTRITITNWNNDVFISVTSRDYIDFSTWYKIQHYDSQ